MKRVYFSNYDDINNPFYGGGGALAIHETAKRLAKRYKVTVVTGNYMNAKNVNIDNVTYKRIGPKFGGPKLGQILFQVLLPFYLKKQKFDIWFESFTPPFSTTCLPLFTKKPVVGVVHMLAGADMKRKYKIPFDRFESLGLLAYKDLIVTNENTGEKLKKINNKLNITLIPNGVETFNKKGYKIKNQILFLGRIEIDQKGIDLLLTAFKKVSKELDLKLILAGSGEAKQLKLLNELIKKNNLEQKVILKGKVEKTEKSKLLGESLCIIIPSRFETFSLTALEALANRLPIINFDIEGLSWIPEGASLKVKSFDTNLLSRKIIEISKNKKLKGRLINNGYDFSKKFTWQKNVNLYEKIINNLT